jgi:hypothetical protein
MFFERICQITSVNLKLHLLKKRTFVHFESSNMKNTALLLFTFASLLLTNELMAQTGDVQIVSDPRLELLVKKQGMPVPPATSVQITGYRLQLIFDSDRKVVDEARAKFISQHPKVDSYLIYNAPNYILKVGDFRTQMEADKWKNILLQTYPTCFVVREKINLPRIDQ